jgi:hypothetical protein
MTDDRLNIIAKALALGFLAFIMLLVFIAEAFGQDTGKDTGNHDHKTVTFKRFDSIRLNPPAKITGIIQTEQGERIEWVSYDRYEIRNGAFTLSKDTEKDPKVKKGTWTWIVFCNEDQFVYAIYPLSEKQLGAVKR